MGISGRPWRTLTGRSGTRRSERSVRTPSAFAVSGPAKFCKARRDSDLRGIHGSRPSALVLLPPSQPRGAHRARATPASRGDESGKEARWAMRFGNLPFNPWQSVALNFWLSILSPQSVPFNPCISNLLSQICASRSNTPALSIRRSRSSAPVLKKTQMRGAPVLPAPPNSSGTKSTLQVRAPPRNRQVATPPGYRGNITSPWTENACPAAGRQA